MKFLIIRNDNIGDLACTTPLIEVLCHAYPKATLDFLGNSYNVDLVRHDPRLSHLWHYEKAKHLPGLWRKINAWLGKIFLLLKLRKQHYDCVIIAVPVFNKRTTALASWIKPKAIYGARTHSHRLPCNYHSIEIDQKISHVLQVLTYAQALGIKVPPPERMSLFLSPEEKNSVAADRKVVPGAPTLPIIGLQISARRPKQRWSYEQWSRLVSALLPHARIRLLWSPGSASTRQHPGDDALAKELAAAFPNILAKPTTNLRGIMTAFSACDLIVGSDGGAMHIAAALDVATITLFGDIDPAVWRPYSKKGFFFTSPTDTLTDLDPNMIAKKVIEIMSLST